MSVQRTMLAALLSSAAWSLIPSAAYQIAREISVVDPRTGSTVSSLDGAPAGWKTLLVILPQLGEFDSSEYVEHLLPVKDDLDKASIFLRVVGIGDVDAANRFAKFTGLSTDNIGVDPSAKLHEALKLHAGPQWRAPDFVSDDVKRFLLNSLPGGVPSDPSLLGPTFDAWLCYLAQCAGIAAPGTLPEIARGYFGDRTAPERLRPDAVVTAGPVEIGPGVGPVKLGPFRYTNGWAEEEGYQRPVELATVRLRNMVEVLSNWDMYVSDPTHIAKRGATFLFDSDGASLYEYKTTGVLTYSNTMSRPLTFLTPFIGAKALNPLGLGDISMAAAETGATKSVEPVEA